MLGTQQRRRQSTCPLERSLFPHPYLGSSWCASSSFSSPPTTPQPASLVPAVSENLPLLFVGVTSWNIDFSTSASPVFCLAKPFVASRSLIWWVGVQRCQDCDPKTVWPQSRTFLFCTSGRLSSVADLSKHNLASFYQVLYNTFLVC